VPDNVSPEEIEALVGGGEEASSQEVVELRDFRQPRRLSTAQQHTIRTALTQVIPTLEAGLAIWLRTHVTITLQELGEASAVGLFDEFEDPLAIQTCNVGESHGWIVWDNESALRSVITSLGTEIPEDLEPRSLSPMEIGLATDILGVFADHLGAALGLEITPTAFSQDVRAFLAQHELDPGGDPQRLFLHLEMESPFGDQSLRFYLPGILPSVTPKRTAPLSSVPIHLDSVSIEISAELASVDVSLTDLMNIEVGDVIPLGVPIGSQAILRIEGDRAGSALWGQSNGVIAISIQEIESIPEDSTSHD
jgi:flagellar motor switch protein FliM